MPGRFGIYPTFLYQVQVDTGGISRQDIGVYRHAAAAASAPPKRFMSGASMQGAGRKV